MNYKLAKELRDAGFPPKRRGTMLFAPGISLAASQKKWDANSAYAPTLSELIEACGEGYSTLMRWRVDKNVYWQATGHTVPLVNHASSSTPEEAVARLWLALNKK